MSKDMIILLIRIIFWTLVGTAMTATILGIIQRSGWYWVAGIAAYLASGMTIIGMLTVGVSFVLLALAIGHTAGWIHSIKQSLVAVAIGLVIWVVVINTVDDYWVFFPFDGYPLTNQHPRRAGIPERAQLRFSRCSRDDGGRYV